MIEHKMNCTDNNSTDRFESISIKVLIVAQVVFAILGMVWQLALKFPAVQRAVGAENQEKRHTIEEIKSNTEIIARAHRQQQ